MNNDASLAERRATLLQAAAAVGRKVTLILDLDRLLSETVDIICDEFGFYYAGVFLVERADGAQWAVLQAGRGEAGAAMLAEGHRLQVGGQSMIGAATARREALIALDVGDEPVHFKNPHLPHTRSEMALPLVVGDQLIGALTVQSEQEAAFSDDDIVALQAMADQLAVAIDNAHLLGELKAAHEELVRTKTFEALATATIEAIHWIGNKALPISAGVERLRSDVDRLSDADPDRVASMQEDLDLIENSARLIVSVQEHLIGPARQRRPRPAMLEDVVRDTAASMELPDGVIDYTAAPGLPLARADTTQLSRALGYVLQNAWEAVAEADERRISIEVAPAGDDRFVAIRVADTGPGVPEEDVDRIWAPFYTAKGPGHAGLGLSAALRILRQMEGQISVENRPQAGAVFEIRVPACDASLPEAELPGGRSILLVDDEDAWSRFVADALEEAGSQVTRSADGRVDPQPFDLILVDDVLEGADPLEVLDSMQEVGACDRTVVVASSMRVERMLALLERGAGDVVLKPYTKAALAEVVGT